MKGRYSFFAPAGVIAVAGATLTAMPPDAAKLYAKIMKPTVNVKVEFHAQGMLSGSINE